MHLNSHIFEPHERQSLLKKGIFLIVVILLLIVGWSAGWFWVVDKVEHKIAKAKTKLEQTGGKIECTNQTTSGYPFRISLNCDDFAIERGASGFRTNGLKSAAQAYQPNKILIEFTSPGQFTQPGGVPLDLEWSSMRSNLKAGLQKLNTVSFQTKDIIAKPQTGERPMVVSDFQYHERLDGENDLDIAIAMIDVKDALLGPLGRHSFDLRSEVSLANIHDEFSRNRSLIALLKTRDVETEVQRFHVVMAGGGGIKISGPANFSSQGTISAKLNVEISDLDNLLSLAIQSNPRGEQQIRQAGQAIKLLSRPDENGVHKFAFSIDQNVLKLGLIPLGRLPRLY